MKLTSNWIPFRLKEIFATIAWKIKHLKATSWRPMILAQISLLCMHLNPLLITLSNLCDLHCLSEQIRTSLLSLPFAAGMTSPLSCYFQSTNAQVLCIIWSFPYFFFFFCHFRETEMPPLLKVCRKKRGCYS